MPKYAKKKVSYTAIILHIYRCIYRFIIEVTWKSLWSFEFPLKVKLFLSIWNETLRPWPFNRLRLKVGLAVLACASIASWALHWSYRSSRTFVRLFKWNMYKEAIISSKRNCGDPPANDVQNDWRAKLWHELIQDHSGTYFHFNLWPPPNQALNFKRISTFQKQTGGPKINKNCCNKNFPTNKHPKNSRTHGRHSVSKWLSCYSASEQRLKFGLSEVPPGACPLKSGPWRSGKMGGEVASIGEVKSELLWEINLCSVLHVCVIYIMKSWYDDTGESRWITCKNCMWRFNSTHL